MPDKILTASKFSEIFWFESLRLPAHEQTRYHVASVTHHDNSLDAQRLSMSLQALVDGNYNLRSVFRDSIGELKQIILDSVVVNLLQVSALSDKENKQLIKKHIDQPFDLSQGPLFRFVLINNTYDDSYTLLLVCHHIVVDGMQYFRHAEELEKYYQDPSLGQDDKAVIKAYEDYLAWERAQLGRTNLEFALDELNQFPFSVNLPLLNEGAAQGVVIASRKVNSITYNALEVFAQENQCSLFNILKIAWGSIVAKYAGQSQLIVSYPFSVKRKAYRNVKGSLVNTLLYYHDSDQSFLRLLQRETSHYRSKAHRNNFYLSILDIEEAVNGKLHLSAGFTYSSFLQEISLTPESKATSYDELEQIGASEILLRYGLLDSELIVQLVGVKSKFTQTMLADMARCFETLLSECIAQPGTSISQLTCLSNEDEAQVLDRSAGVEEFVQKKSLLDIFNDQSDKYPTDISLSYGDKAFTYAELDIKTNQLSGYIKRYYEEHVGRALQPGDLIGLYFERVPEMLIGLLGVLKSGAAYVPMSPDHPVDRIDYMLTDADCQLVLTQSHFLSVFKHLDIESKAIAIDTEPYVEEAQTTEPWSGSLNDLAYVIYTSGTTGQPKGVMVTHGNFSNFLQVMLSKLGQGAINSLSLTSYVFDIFGLEYGLPLISGGMIALSSHDRFAEDLQRHKEINLIQQTPSVWEQIIQGIKPGTLRKHTALLVGGEAGSSSLINSLLKLSDTVLNVYGPTETTIWSSAHQYTPGDHNPRIIGKPLGNEQCYVLDKHKQLVPVGVVGELHIGGAGLARGYLNREALTAERFIENPYATESDKRKGYDRLYKTGDLVRWREDGSLEYIGREDFQVKLRGFRIELGEIEAALRDQPGIEQSAVLVRGEGERRYLVGYYVGADTVTESSLRAELQERLPDYMVPQVLYRLDAMPLTVNGKLDRAKLPEVELGSGIGYVAPRNEVEAELCEIWQEVLGIERVGIEDDFFNLGGNSILMIRVLVEISKSFGVDVTVTELFERPVVRAIAGAVVAPTHSKDDEYIDLETEARLEVAISAQGCQLEQKQNGAAVLLTGATGFVGSYLLHELLDLNCSLSVYCLVRAPSKDIAMARVKSSMDDYGIWHESYRQRILPIIGDLAQENLGLSLRDYDSVTKNVAAIYHNGAYVHHLKPYEQLKPANVVGTESILRLAVTSRLKAVHYISTLSIFNGRNGVRHVAEDADIDHEKITHSEGYIGSKWVAEKLILMARDRGVPTNIYRLGRIVGDSETGACNPDDMFYRYIHTCVDLDAYCDAEFATDITPVDTTAKAIVCLSKQVNKTFHIRHPEIYGFNKPLDYYDRHIKKLKKVDLLSWVKLIETRLDQGYEVKISPYLPMIKGIQKRPGYQIKVGSENTVAELKRQGLVFPAINDNLLANYFHFLLKVWGQ